MSETLPILDRLIGFDTVSARSNLALIAYAEAHLAGLGFRVTRIEAPGQEKAGLYAEIGPEGPGGILLSAHSDVVPVEGQSWSSDPFAMREEGGRLYGRGTTDMKGYLAAMLSLAGRAAGAELAEPLKLVISYDEELGCLGIAEMMGRLTPLMGTPRACFVGEPTSMKVAIGHKGKQALDAVVTGQAGHSAMAPDFVNALYVMNDFISEIRALQGDIEENGPRDMAYGIPYTTLHVGLAEGGRALNIVPDQARMRFEFRHLAADAPEALLARIDAAAKRALAPHLARYEGAAIEITRGFAYPGLDVDEGAEIVRFAKGLAQCNEVTKVAFGTEAGFFDGLGIPTVVCGPGSMEGQGHKPDEYLERSQLEACDRMMGRILAELSA